MDSFRDQLTTRSTGQLWDQRAQVMESFRNRIPSSASKGIALDNIAAEAFSTPVAFTRRSSRRGMPSTNRPRSPGIKRHFSVVMEWGAATTVVWENAYISIYPVKQFTPEDLEVECAGSVPWGGKYDLQPFTLGTGQRCVAQACARRFNRPEWANIGGCFLEKTSGSKRKGSFGLTTLTPYFLSPNKDWRKVIFTRSDSKPRLVYVPDPMVMMTDDQRRLYCSLASKNAVVVFQQRSPVRHLSLSKCIKVDSSNSVHDQTISAKDHSMQTRAVEDKCKPTLQDAITVSSDSSGRSSDEGSEPETKNLFNNRSIRRRTDLGGLQLEIKNLFNNRSIRRRTDSGGSSMPMEDYEDEYECLYASWLLAQKRLHDLKQNSSMTVESTSYNDWQRWKEWYIFTLSFMEALTESLAAREKNEAHEAVLRLNDRRLGFKGLTETHLAGDVLLVLSLPSLEAFDVSTFEKMFGRFAIPEWEAWERIEEVVGRVDLQQLVSDGGKSFQVMKQELLNCVISSGSELSTTDTLERLYDHALLWHKNKIADKKQYASYSLEFDGGSSNHTNDDLLQCLSKVERSNTALQLYMVGYSSMREFHAAMEKLPTFQIQVVPGEEYECLKGRVLDMIRRKKSIGKLDVTYQISTDISLFEDDTVDAGGPTNRFLFSAWRSFFSDNHERGFVFTKSEGNGELYHLRRLQARDCKHLVAFGALLFLVLYYRLQVHRPFTVATLAFILDQVPTVAELELQLQQNRCPFLLDFEKYSWKEYNTLLKLKESEAQGCESIYATYMDSCTSNQDLVILSHLKAMEIEIEGLSWED